MIDKIFIDPKNIDNSLIKKAVDAIAKGGIVALPTETVYGLGGLSEREDVVERLYAVKERSKNKPFSLALGSANIATSDYFDALPPFGYRLIEKFWPGPLTLIYYSRENKKIGIRIPANVIANKILRELKAAVYLPSANISGQKEAVSAAEVESVFNGKIDLIVDGGECTYSSPSTVLDLTCRPFKVLRKGIISERDIAKVFVRKRILFVCTGNTCRSPMAQFLLEKYLSRERPYFKDRYEIISRGISVSSGFRATDYTANILKDKENLDMYNFFAKKLDHHTILSSDLIFVMEDGQSDYILRSEPKAEGKVFNLKKFLPADKEKDIPDPIGKGMFVYEEAYSLIKSAILELKNWL